MKERNAVKPRKVEDNLTKSPGWNWNYPIISYYALCDNRTKDLPTIF